MDETRSVVSRSRSYLCDRSANAIRSLCVPSPEPRELFRSYTCTTFSNSSFRTSQQQKQPKQLQATDTFCRFSAAATFKRAGFFQVHRIPERDFEVSRLIVTDVTEREKPRDLEIYILMRGLSSNAYRDPVCQANRSELVDANSHSVLHIGKSLLCRLRRFIDNGVN